MPNKPKLLIGRTNFTGNYEVCYSDDGNEFTKIYEGIGDDMTVSGNFEYDSQTHGVFVVREKMYPPTEPRTFTNSIQKINFDSKRKSHVASFTYYSAKSEIKIRSLAFDWVTKNLYFADDEAIKVVNANDVQKLPKILYTFRAVRWPKIGVFPNQGYIVVKTSCKYLKFTITKSCTIWSLNFSVGTITRFDQDGSNPLVLYKGYSEITNVALDYFKQDVYWTEAMNGKVQVHYVNLYGGEVNTYDITGDPIHLYDGY